MSHIVTNLLWNYDLFFFFFKIPSQNVVPVKLELVAFTFLYSISAEMLLVGITASYTKACDEVYTLNQKPHGIFD